MGVSLALEGKSCATDRNRGAQRDSPTGGPAPPDAVQRDPIMGLPELDLTELNPQEREKLFEDLQKTCWFCNSEPGTLKDGIVLQVERYLSKTEAYGTGYRSTTIRTARAFVGVPQCPWCYQRRRNNLRAAATACVAVILCTLFGIAAWHGSLWALVALTLSVAGGVTAMAYSCRKNAKLAQSRPNPPNRTIPFRTLSNYPPLASLMQHWKSNKATDSQVVVGARTMPRSPGAYR